MGSNCETSVQEQDATVCPGGEETAILWGCGEAWIVTLEGNIDVFEGRRCGCRWADREGETMGLVEAVIGVLTNDDGFDGVEWGMARPKYILYVN